MGNPLWLKLVESDKSYSCAHCKGELLPGDDIAVCPKCREMYHKICWDTNVGCVKCGEKNSLITQLVCKKCGCKYSSSEPACPKCGAKFEIANEKSVSKTFWAIVSSVLSILIMAGAFFYNQKFVAHNFKDYAALANAEPLLVLRENADFSSDVLVKIPKSTTIIITNEKGEFAETSYDGYVGWVNKGYIVKTSNDVQSYYAVANADPLLLLRENADTSSKTLTKIPKDSLITVVEEKGNFAKTSYEDFTGWVNKDYVKKIESTKVNYKAKANAEPSLFLREKPDKSSETLIKIPYRTELTIVEESRNFAKTVYNSRVGWVNKDYIEKVDKK